MKVHKRFQRKFKEKLDRDFIFPWLERKNKQFPQVKNETTHINPSELYFGGQDVTTFSFFKKSINNIHIKDFPYYRYLTGNEDYLKQFFKSKHTDSKLKSDVPSIGKKIDSFVQLVEDIQENGVRTPIEYFIRDDGKKIIVKGSKRASIAYYYNILLPGDEISMKEYIFRNLKRSNGESDISTNALPYCSLFYKNKELIYGKRRDILERIIMIKKVDLQGKSILDMGSNIGATSFAAVERGAKLTYGLEFNKEIASSAIKINVAFNYPCRFIHADLSQEIKLDRKFDTGFCFSINKWVNNDLILAENIVNHVQDVLYFETHVELNIPEEIKKLASNIEFLGNTGAYYDRKLYRLLLK